MGMYQAVILAAGMGIRLGAVTQNVPKGLVEVGGKTLMARSVENLRVFGIDDIILVTGHKSELYEDFAKDKAYITLVHNNQYAASGNMYSLYLMRDFLKTDILLLESDVLYEKRALERLMQAGFEDGVLLSGYTGAGDEVYVSATDGRVDGISKKRETLKQVMGEWVGISKLSVSLQLAMFAWAEKRFQTSLFGDYESDCMAEVAQQYPIAFEKVDDLVWSEMDDAHHYERMTQVVLPLMIQNDQMYFPNQGTSKS